MLFTNDLGLGFRVRAFRVQGLDRLAWGDLGLGKELPLSFGIWPGCSCLRGPEAIF